MPRKGPAPKRQILPDGKFNSKVLARFINKVMLCGKKSTAETYHLRRAGNRRGEDRPRSDGRLFTGAVQRDAAGRSAAAPRRRRDLSGADGGSAGSPSGDGDALADRFRALARRPLDGREARRTSCSTPPTTPARRSRSAKTRTRWPKPTKPSPIIAGNAYKELRDHGCKGISARTNEKYRHCRAHRCRQDDVYRTHPVLYRPRAQNRRSARRRGHDGLDGAGAGTRHYDHVGGDRTHVARHADQHHRYAWPRGLHG